MKTMNNPINPFGTLLIACILRGVIANYLATLFTVPMGLVKHNLSSSNTGYLVMTGLIFAAPACTLHNPPTLAEHQR